MREKIFMFRISRSLAVIEEFVDAQPRWVSRISLLLRYAGTLTGASAPEMFAGLQVRHTLQGSVPGTIPVS